MPREQNSKQEIQQIRIAGSDMHPVQVQFNKLMASLEKLRRDYDERHCKMEAMMREYNRLVFPTVSKLNQSNLSLVRLSFEAYQKIKLPKVTKLTFAEMICERCDKVLYDPTGLSDEEIELLQSVHSQLTPATQAETDAQAKEEMLEAAEYYSQITGVAVDFSDIDLSMEPDAFEAELKRRMLDASERHMTKKTIAGGRSSKRKPSKAQLAKQKREEEIEEAKTRNIKTLYKQLVKLLHPDLETDETERFRKEQWMKRLTSAYAEGDLRELLQIEMEWMGHENSGLHSASIEKLSIYISVLKEQVADWKNRIDQIAYEAPYAKIARFIHPFLRRPDHPQAVVKAFSNMIAENEPLIRVLSRMDDQTRECIKRWSREFRSFS
ncbi:MAG: hypothetical protein B9S37_04515 [Verrucomicrobiia bacterium Tous-C3TDCM]|nr:MAG: hypothetical protein B9S37_04515 [Verrucomicrobiae bacterium Tous-C3TDCM]PAZ06779.1 MAG: hypothetical protein CAK88_02445 [Verrucomicrobiae bacterium AMD-G2]